MSINFTLISYVLDGDVPDKHRDQGHFHLTIHFECWIEIEFVLMSTKVSPPNFPFRAPLISLGSFKHHHNVHQRAWRGPEPPNGFLDSIFRQALLSNDTDPVEIEPDALGQALLDALLSKHRSSPPLSFSSPSAPLIAPGVQCSDIAGQGRGLLATKPIYTGQRILNIPLDAAITPEKAAQMSSLRERFEKTPPLPDWTLLAVWLAELLYRTTSTHSSTSSNSSGIFSNFSGCAAVHAAYAAVLPETTDCILEWSDEEVNWLRGSHLHTLAVDIRTAAQTSWKELEPIVNHAERAGLIEQGILTEKALKHAFALLLSRLIRITWYSGTTNGTYRGDKNGINEVEVLCPWADFINHDSNCSSFLQVDQKNENIVLVADRNYQPGEQIFASYGQKTSGEMLLSYGFVPEEGSNPHDACLIFIEEDLEKAKNHSKNVFPVKMGAVPESLFEALCNRESRDGGGVNDSRGEQLLVDLCKRKLETYSISLEDAKAELLSMSGVDVRSNGGSVGSKKGSSNTTENRDRREAVLKILVNEQKILARTIFLMKQQLKQTSKR